MTLPAELLIPFYRFKTEKHKAEHPNEFLCFPIQEVVQQQ